MKLLVFFTAFSLLLTGEKIASNHALDDKVNDSSSVESKVVNHNQVLKRQNNIAMTYDVVFDCNGGVYDSTIVSFQQTVIAGSLLNEPDTTKMARNNCTFSGWYTLNGTSWNFEEDTVNEDITLRAKWNWDDSYRLENWSSIDSYFSEKYYLSTGWRITSKKSVKDVSGHLPVEVKGSDTDLYPTSDIETAIETSGIASSYGGCGPLAMIGILDYFARYENYTSIMNNPQNSTDRIQLAYDVFTETNTIEMPKLKNEEAVLARESTSTFSGGGKNTLTLPGDYVNAFNSLMSTKYNLNNQLSAHSQGWMLTSLSSKINKIKQSIDLGLPVTVYAGLAGSGDLGNHYVNVYEYQNWMGIDRDGKAINNVVFNVRVNWGWGQSSPRYMDATMLSAAFSGVIYYEVKDNNQLIRPIDFSTDFVNENGQGQYFFYEKTADITTLDGFTFGTSRLRCGYIENQYLVLSANRSGAGLATLEMNFNINVKAMNFDISL